jgi:hypothetical protein
MAAGWPELPYEAWRETRDTLHMHTQVLGKLAVVLAPPEPQLQHTALRLTARGFETQLLPAPDHSGALLAALDLHRHEAVVEHSDGRERRIPLTPNRSVADVTRDVVAAAGANINMRPQETPWTTPLDEDTEHATYDERQVAAYLDAATRAALVLAELRAPYRGRSTQVNAWWGSFDLAVNLFSGRSADPPSQDFIMRNSMDAQDITVGWWPGDTRYPRAAFYAYAHPAPDGLAGAPLEPASARWDGEMGLFLLDWDDALAEPDPHAAALAFARSVARHACVVCDWDPATAASLEGKPPPVA